MTRVTMLGSGASSGVPLIGCDCAVCRSGNPKNRRTRVSVLVETPGGNLLIDASPDLREQALRENVRKVDALLITHNHADHTHGIDDVRSFNYLRDAPLPLYADAQTLAGLHERFGYVFQKPVTQYGWFRPSLEANTVMPGTAFKAAGAEVLPMRQIHGTIESLGFRIGNFAYSTDANLLPEETLAALEGVDFWIVDCLGYKSAPTHAHLEQTLRWVERICPKRAILTHMSHVFDYETLKSELPSGVEPGWDGLTFEF